MRRRKPARSSCSSNTTPCPPQFLGMGRAEMGGIAKGFNNGETVTYRRHNGVTQVEVATDGPTRRLPPSGSSLWPVIDADGAGYL